MLRSLTPLLFLTAALILASCRRDDRRQGDANLRHRCVCEFLTDTDDTSHQRVDVCSRSADEALSRARGCAQTGAPAPIQTCRCTPLPSASAVSCADDTCVVHEEK